MMEFSRRDSLRNLALLGATTVLGATTLVAGSAEAAQPKMQEALTDLLAAKTALEHALHDKSGHRLKAMDLVDQAIAEVEAGIAAGS